MTKKKGFLEFVSDNRFIHILLSIILGFLVGAIFLVVMGLSVGSAYGRLLNSITNLKGFSYVIVYSIPYIVVGLSVAFSFKTGVFNIGAEGQFVVGSMAAACVGILAGGLPKPLLIPLCFLAAMLAGAIWGVIVGVLKTKWGINEVLSMIMFNWVAFYLSNFIAGIPAIHSDGTAEATKNISENASTLLPKDMIASLGLCPTANISVNRSILTALAISGALAGLGGALQLMGMGSRISVFSSQEGFGFAGIVVALIGCSNPFGVLIAGIFYGALMFGGSKLNLVGAPTQLINVIVGTVVFFIAISIIFQRLKYLKKAPKTPAAQPKEKEADEK